MQLSVLKQVVVREQLGLRRHNTARSTDAGGRRYSFGRHHQAVQQDSGGSVEVMFSTITVPPAPLSKQMQACHWHGGTQLAFREISIVPVVPPFPQKKLPYISGRLNNRQNRRSIAQKDRSRAKQIMEGRAVPEQEDGAMEKASSRQQLKTVKTQPNISRSPALAPSRSPCLYVFLVALDQTIMASTLGAISTQSAPTRAIVWYGFLYLMTTIALQPFCGSIYRLFDFFYCRTRS